MERAELKKYDPALAKKPRWLVFNKADLLEPAERKKRAAALVKRLRWTKPWFVISAIDGEGCKEVTFKVMELLESERRASVVPAKAGTRSDSRRRGNDTKKK